MVLTNLSARQRVYWFALAGGLCLLAYARTLTLPFIADDYLQIRLARDFGPVGGWAKLAADPLYRCRATSLILTYWTEQWFGLNPVAFAASSVAVHILNTGLVLLLGMWRPIGWRVSSVAACFFAVRQNHQEAVMWYAALPELLVFTFVLIAFLCWIRWMRNPSSISWYGACVLAFVLALASKESAVVLVPLALLAGWLERDHFRWRTMLAGVGPLAALSFGYFVLAWVAQRNHLHFNDGTFALGAPFWSTIVFSIARLWRWWPAAGLIALLVWRASEWKAVVAVATLWSVITLLPYSFLTYMSHVPSRHVYLAGVGAVIVLAAAFLELHKRTSTQPWFAALIVVLIVGSNCAYLWTRKYEQFVERAEPTERLVDAARSLTGEVYLDCFPYDLVIARSATELRVGTHVVPVVASNGMSIGGPRVSFCSGANR